MTRARFRAPGARLVGALVATVALTAAPHAFAYRPFDGTDAAVAEVGEFEAELGSAYTRIEDGQATLALPTTVLNLGLSRHVEAVVDVKPLLALGSVSAGERFELADTDLLVKWVFVPGSLQGQRGPSVALETGPLLPEFHGDAGFGYQASVIVSQRWQALMAHVNALAALSRTGALAAAGSVILEGLPASRVRPVTELLLGGTRGHGVTYSALEGAIWTLSDVFALDAAGRVAREEHRAVFEARIGFTWAVALWTGRDRGR
jgi:hypothetical protein